MAYTVVSRSLQGGFIPDSGDALWRGSTELRKNTSLQNVILMAHMESTSEEPEPDDHAFLQVYSTPPKTGINAPLYMEPARNFDADPPHFEMRDVPVVVYHGEPIRVVFEVGTIDQAFSVRVAFNEGTAEGTLRIELVDA